MNTTADFARALEQARTQPETLSTSDLLVLREFGGPALVERLVTKAAHPAIPSDKNRMPAGVRERGNVRRFDVDAVAGAVVDMVKLALAPLAARLEALERAELERRRSADADDSVSMETKTHDAFVGTSKPS